ncbi:retrovirus-related pol polyprotein LINE-1, partial [Tanacetum coccineum]
IEAVASDGHLRSCPGLGVVDGGRRTRSYDRLAGSRRIRETKWKGSRAREGNGYKLWYSGSSNARNGVGIILAGRLKDNVVRVGLSDAKKKRFWDALDELVRECPTDQRLIIWGDLKGHIGAATDRYAGVHGGFGFGDRNEEGCTILEFAIAHELVVVNSFFKKSDAYLITFQSGGHNTQINYFLVHRGDLRACKDCRAYLGKPRILWKNLKGEAVETFRATVVERLAALEEVMSASGADQMWNTIARVMKDAAKESLGVANETAITHSTHRESWWFYEEVQTKVALKQSRFKELLSCREGNQEDTDFVKERYKVAKREAKIAVVRAKDKAYEELYKKLDSKEGANDIYKIAKARERRRRDIGNVIYIKDEGGRTIVREKDIRKR